jgi:AcrR family transcriptional regulator
VVSAAARLFSDRGFQSVSIREITRAAGVSLPVIYWFFRSKRALYVECYFRLVRRSLQLMSQSLEGVNDPHEILYTFTVTLCRHNFDYLGSRIVHRVLLDRDMPVLKTLARTYFDTDVSRRVLSAAATLVGKASANLKVFAIYSLAAGFVEHAPFWSLSPTRQWKGEDPEAIALYVLETIFPDVNSWPKIAARVQQVRTHRGRRAIEHVV